MANIPELLDGDVTGGAGPGDGEVPRRGVAQEKAKALRGAKANGQFQFNRDKTVYVNHYYFYIDDEDFGPLFLKVCSYAPCGIKLCLSGHQWAKRPMDKRGIGYEALDNGFLPLQPADRKAGCEWDLSIWQMEVSPTQIFASFGKVHFGKLTRQPPGEMGKPPMRIQASKSSPGDTFFS
jgi:hypothetical protein